MIDRDSEILVDQKWIDAVNKELESQGSPIRFAYPKFPCNAAHVIHVMVLDILNRERENAGLPTKNA